MSLKGFFGHLGTITRHRHKVIAHCAKAGILWQGLRHDLSKYSPTEFIPGVKYYQGIRSPNEAERELNGYSLAWMHHKGRNKHHFEYWYDYNAKVKTPIIPFKYMKEMVCDRIAASKVYYKDNYNNNRALEYFNSQKDKIKMDKRLISFLEKVFIRLSKEGESFLNNKNLKDLYLKHISK